MLCHWQGEGWSARLVLLLKPGMKSMWMLGVGALCINGMLLKLKMWMTSKVFFLLRLWSVPTCWKSTQKVRTISISSMHDLKSKPWHSVGGGEVDRLSHGLPYRNPAKALSADFNQLTCCLCMCCISSWPGICHPSGGIAVLAWKTADHWRMALWQVYRSVPNNANVAWTAVLHLGSDRPQSFESSGYLGWTSFCLTTTSIMLCTCKWT